jgi:hypothetical protein
MHYITRLTVLGALAISTSTVLAQTPAPKTPTERMVSIPTTPERVIADMEAAAKRQKDRGGTPAARGYNFRTGLPDNAAEFAKLGGYAVMLLTVISRKSEELPLKRVYIQSSAPDITLQRLSSWRSNVDSKLLAYEWYGPYREDGFYLVPVGPMTRDGMMIGDFAPDKLSLRILKLPSEAALQRKFAQPDPVPGAKPDARALRDLIQRKYPGFPMPKFP